ncbi:MAG: PEGA domain-containing protein, partial [Deltaproteobacteria bacterium]|nr:PEGA domain-containing protein [Deltaproteobacteria bacterium]
PETAGLMLDACLYLARAYLDAGDPDAAERQAQDCVRLAPAATPNPRVHPPSIIDLYAAAQKPSAARGGTLTVESEPAGCDLRINGTLVGKTPLASDNLYPGSYQVQVECRPDEPGRVHRVEVPLGSQSLFVIDRFERIVRSSTLLYLQFEEAPDPQELARHAREVARALPASAVMVASLVGPDVLRGARSELDESVGGGSPRRSMCGFHRRDAARDRLPNRPTDRANPGRERRRKARPSPSPVHHGCEPRIGRGSVAGGRLEPRDRAEVRGRRLDRRSQQPQPPGKVARPRDRRDRHRVGRRRPPRRCNADGPSSALEDAVVGVGQRRLGGRRRGRLDRFCNDGLAQAGGIL